MSDPVDSQGHPGQPTDQAPETHPPDARPSPPDAVSIEPVAMDAIDREVAEAMASMDASDLAELRGEELTLDAGQSAESLSPGSELTGTIAGLTDDEVILEFGPKTQGVLSRLQFGKKEVLEVGRRIDVVVEKFDKASDILIVNRKGAMLRAT